MKRAVLLILGAAVVSVGFYLIIAGSATKIGFPLDDAWIHQVFARNLAQRGEFSYNPGQPAAGSTSPLWTILLVPGYFFGGEFYKWWAYFLGLVFLVLTAIEVMRLYRLMFPASMRLKDKGLLSYMVAGLFTVCEWRLVWAADSGMETMFFTFGTLWLIRRYLQTAYNEDRSSLAVASRPVFSYAQIGFAGGLLALVRPEGMVLLGLIGLDTARRSVARVGANQRGLGWMAARWMAIGLAWLLPILPYLAFNYSVNGTPLPTTFYAKANFYSGDGSIGSRLGYFWDAFIELFWHGQQILFLLPGIAFALYLLVTDQRGDWRPLVWPPVLVILYSIQLPVTYHHGRYLMPLIPIFIIYGVYGTEAILHWLKELQLLTVARVVPFILAVPIAISWFNQAQAYQFDVKLINDEQVKIGMWLRDNTPPDVTVATHDIGAIGYFSERRLVDTAGLVSREFVPIVQNQPAILEKLKAEKVDYFAMFPDWYPELYATLNGENRKVFQPAEKYLALFGKENMIVYRLFSQEMN